MVGRFLKVVTVLVAIWLATAALVAMAAVQPRVMGDDIFDMLTKGYDNLSQSKFEAAQMEFENVIRIDFDNPFANNNLAVLMEKQGRLPDAMMYLNIGDKFSEHYLNKVDKAFLLGGLCAAVNPEKATAETSMVAQVITDNKKKIAEKMGSKFGEASKGGAK